MRKWLVGLLAAGMCAASALAVTDTLDLAFTGVSGTSYTEWSGKAGDSGAVYAGQSAGGNSAIQLRSSNNNSGIITTGSGGTATKVTVAWNENTADDREVSVYGKADAYSAATDLYSKDTQGTLIGSIKKGESTELSLGDGYEFIGLRSKSGALYLDSVAIEWEGGSAEFSVTFDKENWFEVEQGTGSSVTAIAKHGVEPYTYEWSCDKSELLTGSEATLAIPDTLEADEYTLACLVTDAELNSINALIGLKVVAPKAKFAIECAVGIPNGSVSADKTEATEGETVTLTATPAAGYKLEHFLVNGIAISANTFPMPAEDVIVSASFVEKPVVAGFTKITSLSELTEGEYVITGAKAEGEEYAMKAEVSTTSTAYILRRDEAVTIEEDTVTDAEDSIIWTLEQGENGWTIYNEAVGYAGYVKSGNSAGAEAEPSAKSSWTITESETAGLFLLNNVDKEGRYLLYNASSPRFACYTNITSGKHLALYKGSSGPAVFSVTFDKKDGFEVPFGTADSITATAKNGSGDYSYAWSGDLTGEGATLEIPATLASGPYTVTVTATDNGADAQTVEKSISFTVAAPVVKYQVQVAIGIPNGSVSADKTEAEEGEVVTLTATPDAGYKLEHFLVNDIAISANTFPMPAEDVLVSASFVEKPVVAGFTKITSLSELTEGEYVITGAKAEGEEYAMKAEVSTTSTAYILRRDEAVTIEEDTVTDAEDSIIWTLEQGENSWTIYNEAVGYAGYVKSGNSAGAEAEPSAKSSWTITESETAGLFLLNNVDKEGRYLLYNASSPRFACYTNINSGKHLALYKGSSGPAVFSVTFDKKDGFEVPFGTADSITATAKNGSGDYSYAWSGDLTGEGATLEIPATLASGPYTVTVTATDNGADAQTVEKSISFTVAAPVVKYQVQVAIGIPNGSVSADKTEAEEGEVVTLTATPDAGYKLEHFLVNDVAISANTFPMPAEDVLVSASFVEKPVGVGFTKITSLDELEEGEYVITGAKAEGEEYAMMASISTGSTKFLERRETAVELEEDVVTDAEDSIIWTLAQGDDGWTIYNEAVGYAGYVASGNSSGAEAEPSAKSSWTITESETEGLFLLTNVGTEGRYLLYNVSNPRFACYEKTTSGKHLALYKGSSGPATFSVKLAPASYFEVEVGAEATITATPKSASGDVTYAWTIGGTPVDATGAVLTLDTTAATEVIEVVCTATDGAGAEATASVSYKVVAPAPKYQVGIAIGIPNGSVSADKTEAEEGELVTLTATPAAGYKLEHFLVNDIAISANTFPMPAEDVLVSASFVEITGDTYTLVESADDFEEGAEYLIVAYAKDKFTSALKNEASGSRIGVEEVVIADDNTVTTDSDAIVWKIQAGAADGQYVLFNEAAGVYAAGPKSEGNNAQLLADGMDALAQWTLDFADVPAVAIGSVAYPERQLNRNSAAQYNYFATYKGSGTKPFLFKKAGAPRPKIVYSGETTIALGGTFEIIFGLLNYDGDFTWEMGSREGGTIAQEGRDGLYTWTPTSAGDVTIKVVARNGELDIASKEVVLTVTDGPQPGEPAIQIAGPDTGVVGEELSCKVWAINMKDPTVYFEGNYKAPDGSSLSTEDIVFENGACTFTPDVAGVYWIEFCAYDGDAGICDKWTVTVSGGSSGPEIDDITIDPAGGTFTFTVPDGTAVETATDLVAGNWVPYVGEIGEDGKVSIPMNDPSAYYRLVPSAE